jgi:membrane protein
VKKQRSIFRTFTDYLAMFFMFPILIVLSSGLSIYMVTIVSSLPDFLLLGSAIRFLIRLAPYVLMSALFMALYLFMPNTHVKIKNVVVPGILAGIAMQWLQFFYINSQIWMTSYNAIYGSFAALPMFMLWVQISWTICLFGAELCYTSQNLDYYDYHAKTDDISHRYQIMLHTILMSRICLRFSQGKRPYTLEDLTNETGIPVRIANDLLYKLVDCNMLIEITSDEKGEASRFVPSESLENFNLGVMVDRLEAVGKWKIDLPVSQLLNSKWMEAMDLRGNYLKSLRNIRLEDVSTDSSNKASDVPTPSV